ncbi:MAG TPA: quinolinate synthase NadA [Blastocatellia bacterium]|nr:quinolinate synthase NadA [Blastocatellia bacterium]
MTMQLPVLAVSSSTSAIEEAPDKAAELAFAPPSRTSAASVLSRASTAGVATGAAVQAQTEDARRAELMDEIRALARQRNAMILAHNYQVPDVQDVADVTGDSLGLSLEAQKTDAELIVFCGVHFMAESAKILNPEKRVLLPNLSAGCSLADSITPESLQEWKDRYPDHTVVTYVNSSADVKAMSDICCTSANAVSVIRSLASDKVLFTPDRNLGNWVKKQVPEKNVVVYDGVCPTHDVLRGANVGKAQQAFPDAVVIAHPECREDVIAMADEVCSTTAMLDRVARHPEAKTFIVATESGIVHQMRKRYPDREFIVADGCIGCRLHCPYMKMISLESVRRSLLEDKFEITVEPDVLRDARLALERMLQVPRDN